MDDYETDLQMDDHNEIDVCAGEDEVATTGMPEALWCDADVKQHPPEPDSWVDRLADEVEVKGFAPWVFWLGQVKRHSL